MVALLRSRQSAHINDDRAVAAMEFMRTLVKYAPTEANHLGLERRDEEAFVEGRAGILYQRGEWFSVFDDPAQSKVVGLVEAAPSSERALRRQVSCSFEGDAGASVVKAASYLGLSLYSKSRTQPGS